VVPKHFGDPHFSRSQGPGRSFRPALVMWHLTVVAVLSWADCHGRICPWARLGFCSLSLRIQVETAGLTSIPDVCLENHWDKDFSFYVATHAGGEH
jgi:hypothetical protein